MKVEDKKKDNDDFLNDEFDFSNATVGPVVSAKGVKLPVSIRLDAEVISYFKEKAGRIGQKAKYQTLINEALKEYIGTESLQSILLSDEFTRSLGEKIKKAL